MSSPTDAKLTGVIPPIMIPLTMDREVDDESLSNNLNRMIDAGVDGVFVSGSSGEVAFMDDDRRYEVLEKTIEIVDGRVPILSGVIDIETPRVVKHVERCNEYPIAGVVATAPFYALGGPKENERHFRVLREHTDLPIYAYDLPVCVHTKLDGSMLVRLGQEGVLQGVKDSSGDDVGFRWLMLENEEAGHPLQLFTGHEVVVDGCMLGGADGSVPGLANIDPYVYVEMDRAARAKDWGKVRDLQDRAARLMYICRVVKATTGYGAGIGAFKTAAWQLGLFNTNQMYEPVARLEGEDVERIVRVLKKCGLMDADAPIRQ